MKLNILLTLLIVILSAAGTLCAQQIPLIGKITDVDDNTPVSFANVVLLKQDSTYITGTTSDPEGRFELKDVSQEPCILAVSYIGYEPGYLSVIPSEENTAIEILLRQSSVVLGEVIIQAHSVIQKADRKVILPTEEQLKTATDGADLIRKMQLPRLMIDPMSGEVTISGNGEVQLRINGVQVTSAEVASLLPTDILRIEYHDDPGVRYGSVAAVIDYITRRKESGGNVNGSFTNSLGRKRFSADDRLSLKYNNRNSEFSANALFVQRKQDWVREYDEVLRFPDHDLHRLEIGEPAPFNKMVFGTNLNYSLAEANKYFFNVQLRYTRNDFPGSFEDRRSKLYMNNSDTPVSIYDHTVEKANTPALDLYFQRNLAGNQQLIFNVVGTYIDTHTRRIYRETKDNHIETEILSVVSGNKYSLIAEGIYEKKTEKGRLTGGIRHMQSYMDNEYDGTTTANVSMRQAETYGYAEYQDKIGKWGYMVNLTGVRFYYGQQENHTEKYALQPSARITFEPVRDLYFRYRINLKNNAPSLAAMNDVEQRIDAWQVRRGNPDLKTFRTLEQTFTTGYARGIWAVDLLVGYTYEYNPIMESVLYDNGTLVRIYRNQQSFQNLSFEAGFKLRPWKDHLSISATPCLNRFISTGNDYLHTYTMYELRVNLDFSYGHWLANFTTITPPRFMYGEQMTKSDQMYTFMAGYKQPKWSLMLGAMNLFTNEYKTDNRNWAALNPVDSKIHTHNNKAFIVKLNINLNYGKQFRGEHKRTNNMDTDSGIMQGVK